MKLKHAKELQNISEEEEQISALENIKLLYESTRAVIDYLMNIL